MGSVTERILKWINIVEDKNNPKQKKTRQEEREKVKKEIQERKELEKKLEKDVECLRKTVGDLHDELHEADKQCIAALREQINALLERIKLITTQLNKLRKTFECPVCKDGTCEILFVPCGHLTCRECFVKLNLRCPHCRDEIRKAYKIYVKQNNDE